MLATSIEQSKKLVELGLLKETADMFWERDMNCLGVETYNLISGIRYTKEELKDLFEEFDNLIPAWSLSGLLELMPKHHVVEKCGDDTYACYYMTTPEKWGKTPVDAAYKKIVWLLENKLIKTEEK